MCTVSVVAFLARLPKWVVEDNSKSLSAHTGFFIKPASLVLVLTKYRKFVNVRLDCSSFLSPVTGSGSCCSVYFLFSGVVPLGVTSRQLGLITQTVFVSPDTNLEENWSSYFNSARETFRVIHHPMATVSMQIPWKHFPCKWREGRWRWDGHNGSNTKGPQFRFALVPIPCSLPRD